MDPRGTTAKRQKWGRFLPHQRANVDQVPLPFVNDMEDTLEAKGADRVTINQNGPALGKRQRAGHWTYSRFLGGPANPAGFLNFFWLNPWLFS